MKQQARQTASKSTAFEVKRSALVRRIVHALLTAGVADIPLRELAAAIGTSDRMLLYYFTDKAELVRASLDEVSAQFAERLAGRVPKRSNPAILIGEVLRLFASKELSRPLMVWADLSARGSRGEEPFHMIARDTVNRWLVWLEDRLDMDANPTRRDIAIAILTVIEGTRLLEAFAPKLTAAAIPIFSNAIVAHLGKKKTSR
jgi:AcrR family transcriptional regulator